VVVPCDDRGGAFGDGEDGGVGVRRGQRRHHGCVNDTKAVADQKALAAKADQATQLETEIKRKQEDGQKDLEKRVQTLTQPIYQDIGNALQAFARARGLSVVFDVSKMQGVVMVVNDSVDITDAFIAEYNQRNPATTASASAPGNQ